MARRQIFRFTGGSAISPKLVANDHSAGKAAAPEKNGRTGQFLLFFLIVVFPIFWSIFLWRMRHRLFRDREVAEAGSKSASFSGLVEQFRKERNLGNLEKEKPSSETVRPAGALRKESQKVRNVSDNRSSATVFRWPEPTERREKLENRALFYASMGYSVEEIARILNIGKGEVKLLLNLRGKDLPMSLSDIRIEMAE